MASTCQCRVPHDFTYDVIQDGASFYLYVDNGEMLESIVTYPYRVPDGDVRIAEEARRWMESVAACWGWTLRW